ncbi:MAG TPA: hypothetical protein VGO91_07860 [Pyrinomonadaceae bacterium]|jgi:hypothetical protein|nr:hypothetical protein [Pyrinomonadaceae bacterium]
MLKGFYLTLMIGPAIPIPVPQFVMDALTGVQITNTAAPHSPSGFSLTFTAGSNSPLHSLFLISGGGMFPLMRVVLMVTVNGIPDVLIDGVITKQDIGPSNEIGQSTLTITGVDLTAVMDLIDFSGVPYPAMPSEARVALILAKYMLFGIVPLIIPSILIDVPNPLEKFPVHQGTDFAYLNELADRVGYVFYISPGPVPGVSIAYWGPQIKIGVPQPALNINMDAQTNVESMSFGIDTESKTLPVVYAYVKEAHLTIPIPIPDISPLNPPLGLIPPLPKRIQFMKDTAKLTPIQAVLIGLARASKTSDVVRGSGSLDVLRYGRVLKARQLVGVRGVGIAFDGLYFVQSVTHNIKHGEYKQSFSLTRNGLVSTLPKVPV